jgi:hypothetical protein
MSKTAMKTGRKRRNNTANLRQLVATGRKLPRMVTPSSINLSPWNQLTLELSGTSPTDPYSFTQTGIVAALATQLGISTSDACYGNLCARIKTVRVWGPVLGSGTFTPAASGLYVDCYPINEVATSATSTGSLASLTDPPGALDYSYCGFEWPLVSQSQTITPSSYPTRVIKVFVPATEGGDTAFLVRFELLWRFTV